MPGKIAGARQFPAKTGSYRAGPKMLPGLVASRSLTMASPPPVAARWFVPSMLALSLLGGGCATHAPGSVAGDGASPTGAPAEGTAGHPSAPRLVPRAPTSVSTADPGTQAYDRDVWQTLLYFHEKIRRQVTSLPNGLAAVTESDDPEVATLIKDHALAMRERMAEGRAVRTWDPVFRKLFERHGAVHLQVVLTEKGVRIEETTDDPETLRLMRSHSAGISDMVRDGSRAAQRDTPFVKD